MRLGSQLPPRQVRSAQEELFKQHLGLEVKLFNDEKEHRDDDFQASNYCDHLPKLFKACERDVTVVSDNIGALSERLARINSIVPDATKDMAKKAAAAAQAAQRQGGASGSAAAPERAGVGPSTSSGAAGRSGRRRGNSGSSGSTLGTAAQRR